MDANAMAVVRSSGVRGEAMSGKGGGDNSGEWFPLRRDGAWLEAEHWQRNLTVLRRREDGSAALGALRGVFTPTWSRGQHGTKDLHPVVGDSIMVTGRHELLEVGFMLAQMAGKEKRLHARLLAPDQYCGTCAELRGGLLLRTAGASVEWEPVEGRSGPDWLAHWPGGKLAVEVKCPRVSKRAEARQRIALDFFFEFMRAASEPPMRVETATWLTLHPNERIESIRSVFGSTDLNGVRDLARETAEAVRRNLPSPLAPGRFSAGRAGEFVVELRAGQEPKVQFQMNGLARDIEHDGQRLLELIQKAAKQLDALEAPGLVVLDAGNDYALLGHVIDIERTLRTEHWARKLAGVAIVTQTFTADDEIGDMRASNVINVVPGLQAAALRDTLLTGLRQCDQGHLHADPLLAPPKKCPLQR